MMCFNRRMMKFLLSLSLGLLVGCAGGVPPLDLASSGLSVSSVARLASVGAMAVSGDGRMVAWDDKGLNLIDLVGNQRLRLHDLSPDALCWSPDGAMLAAALYQGDQALLNVFDRSGALVYEQSLPGRVGRLQWPQAGGLTAGVLLLKTFKFGTHAAEQLLRWDARWRVTEIPLYETTLMPITATQLSGQLHQTFDFDLSPLGDEVLYTRVHAPPAFAAFRHLILRNLQTKQERQIAVLPLLGGTGRLAADGESAVIADGRGQIRAQHMWSDKISDVWPGELFDYDALSGLLVVDGQLYKGQDLLVELPEKSRAQLSFAGQFLLLDWHSQLYLLSSYPVERSTLVEGGSLKKLLKLRRLRSRGLIDQNEYLQTRERLLQ